MSESEECADLDVEESDDAMVGAERIEPTPSRFVPYRHGNGVQRQVRVNWTDPDVQRVLLEVKHKTLTAEAAVARLEGICGVRVTPPTVSRQAHKLDIDSVEEIDELIDVGSYSPSSSRDGGEGYSTDETEYPRFEWSLTQRGTRGLMVFESEEVIRLYRLGGKTADDGNTAIYFRCSQCDRLKFRGQNPIKFVDNEPANSLTPVHHEKCLPRSVDDVIKEQLDRRARNLIKTGVAPKRAYEIVRSGAAQHEDMMPDFKRVAKSYYRVRRKSAAHQAARELNDDVDDENEPLVVD